ncbi:MAG: anthrone oxygenase family protein [Ktedonobacteraceae bacterium]
MNLTTVLDFVTVFFAGLLAGALFVIDYGVGPAVAAVLDDQSQIQMRQALILRLRVLVPAIFVLAILLGIAITVLDGIDPGFAFRLAGLLVVLTSFLLTLLGTAPINSAVFDWQPSAPPKNWRTLVSRWERLDRARTLAAVAGFALFLTAMALTLAPH